MKRYFLLLLVVVLHAVNVNAADPFVVSDIRVEGLQRISAGSIFAALPVNVGDQMDDVTIRNSIRALFRTGNFDNIFISRDETVLVVTVEERPSINEINIDGNKAIETDALLDGLKGAGLSEGQVFKRVTLEGMKMELTRQYVSQGRYDASIETDISSLPRNRVAVNINIDEGTTAAIKHINFVGNSIYNDEQLTDLFELKSSNWLSWIRGDDKYSKEKLSGDLDKVASYYLDRGYIQFIIDSTQVSVSPDREAVYISVNVNEGVKHTVGSVDLSGDIVLPELLLRPYIFIAKGQTFSQARVTNTEEWLTKRLGNEGYNFAKVEGIPEINEEDQTVDIKFFIDPGKRTYVNRISFQGNTKTADEVLRREMRQMEAAPASAASIELSRVRLERLGYFKEAQVETLEVPGTDDLINLQYTVEEQSSGSIGASIGFSQDSGLLLGANVQQDNFLGTGKQIGVSLNKSDFLTNLSFSFVDPYYTKDGVSRGFSVFYRVADLDEINLARYTANTFGASLNFGYPIRETERLGFSLGYSNTKIKAGFAAVQEIIASPRPLEFGSSNSFTNYYESQEVSNGIFSAPEQLVPLYDDNGLLLNTVTDADGVALARSPFTTPDELGIRPGFLDENGDTFDNFTLTTTWNQSTLNRGRMATRGASQSVALELAIPGSDLQYYKLTYNGQIFFPLTRSLTLRFRTELGYGDGFGGDDFPFFNNFYSGGFGSVRGFESNTLGPRSTPSLNYRDTGVATLAIIEAGSGGCDASLVTGDVCTGEGVYSGRQVGEATLRDNRASYILLNGADSFRLAVLDPDADPFGGNVLIEGGAELLFPLPFIKDQRSVRTAFFIDIGNVFSTDCGATQANCFETDLDELRYSVGLGLSWITGFGPLTFSYAVPINDGEFDETEAFQFSLGRTF